MIIANRPTRSPSSGISPSSSVQRAPRPRRSLALTTVMALMSAYCILPLLWLLINSTKTNAGLFSSSGLWFAGRFVFFHNIARTLSFQHFIYLRWIGNTVLYTIVGAGIASMIAALGGYALAKYDFPFKRVLFAIVIGAMTIPGTVLAVPTFLLFSKIGITNTPWAVIIPSLVSPFGLYLMRVYSFDSVPDSLAEAARLDGAGELRIFRSVAFRLLAPGFITVLLFQMVATWNNYFLPLIVLNNPNLFPLTVGLSSWSAQANGTQIPGVGQAVYPMVLTGSLLALVPLIVAFVLLQRYWRSGLATGGVK